MDAAAPEGPGELFAQLNGSCPSSPSKPGGSSQQGQRGVIGAMTQPDSRTGPSRLSPLEEAEETELGSLRMYFSKDGKGIGSLQTRETFRGC